MWKRAVSGTMLIFLLIGLLSLTFNVQLVESEPTTIIVPDDFPAIQEAINNAADGDTVFVKAGTYYEHVVVNKTISLLGENRSTTVVDGNWTEVVIDVIRSGVIISGLTVQRSGSVYWENAGIFLDNVKNCTINENILTENSFAGLELNHSHRCIVSGNNIFNNSGVGITVVGGSFNNLSRNSIAENGWSAITLNDETRSNTISENSMTSNNLAVTGHCVNLYRSSSNSIQKNNIMGDDNGIRLEYWSNNNTIAKNNITSNTLTAVSVETSSENNTISGNVISGSISGVVISNSRYVEIFNNTIAHNYGSDWDAGIRLDYAGYSKIHSNLIKDNWRGILLYTTSPHVSIYSNNITVNEFAVRVASGGSNYLNVSDNIVTDNRGYGIGVTGFGGQSNYATISRNLIMNNSDGVALGQFSTYNTILKNNISQNGYGFYIESSTQNTILGNNIIDNNQQVYVSTGSVNNWDGGYLAGGNYWSNHSSPDLYSGPFQNETGSDDIGDQPHIINGENADRYPLINPYPSIHAVSVSVNPAKTNVGQNFSMTVNVTVNNEGHFFETVNVTLYANATVLYKFNITLTEDLIISIIWNTTGFAKGNYTISAYAEPVPGETYTADNTFADVWVIVAMVGDVTGPDGWPDGKVDMRDVGLVARNFGQNMPPTPSNCDVTGPIAGLPDGKIDMRDVGLVASRFGDVNP